MISACISDQLTLLGVGTKVSPRDNSLVSEFESRTVERLITVSLSCSGCDMLLFWERVLRFFLCWLTFVGVLGVELAVLSSSSPPPLGSVCR